MITPRRSTRFGQVCLKRSNQCSSATSAALGHKQACWSPASATGVRLTPDGIAAARKAFLVVPWGELKYHVHRLERAVSERRILRVGGLLMVRGAIVLLFALLPIQAQAEGRVPLQPSRAISNCPELFSLAPLSPLTLCALREKGVALSQGSAAGRVLWPGLPRYP